jgi:MFS family permease
MTEATAPQAAAAPAATASTRLQIPWLVKRNLALFALSQTFTGAGMQFAYGFGPLMVQVLTGSDGLAGLSVALIAASRFLVAYPVGKITDTYGRKPGILLGLALALCGALVLGSSMLAHSSAVFVVGLLVFGMGMNAAQQMRVAATDMFPARFRARALGYLALGSLVGLLVSPTVINFSESYARKTGYEPLALPWFFLPFLIVPGMILVTFVRPDPKEIGRNLAQYYPNFVSPAAQKRETEVSDFNPFELFWRMPILQGIVANCSGQANMSIVMVLTSLILSHHGYSLSAIAVSHVFHSAGMFAFTVPLGMLADRFGRPVVMYTGVAVALAGAALVTFTGGSYLLVTLGTFLVGLGWAGGNVASTALIADQTRTVERGRAIGVNDSAAAFASVTAALVTGPLIALWGLKAAGGAAVVMAIIPFLLLAYAKTRSERY